jgi:hypothetical protein
MVDKRYSNAIGFLRFPLTIGIVFLHYNVLSEIALGALPVHGELPLWLKSLVYIFSYAIPSICVPCFFIISGYLFFANIEELTMGVYKKKLLARTKSLLIPFLLWNIVALIISLTLYYSRNTVSTEPNYSFGALVNTFICSNKGVILYPTEAASGVWPFPILGPMWYVRELFVMALISPLIYFFIKCLRIYFVLIISGLWFVVMILPFEWVGYSNLFINALFFFTGGGYFALNQKMLNMRKSIPWKVSIVWITVLVVESLTHGYINQMIHLSGICLGIVSVLLIVLNTNYECHFIMRCSKMSFFIFALHWLVIKLFPRSLYPYIDLSNTWVLVGLNFMIPFIVLLSCSCLYMLFERCFPKTLSIFNGGR